MQPGQNKWQAWQLLNYFYPVTSYRRVQKKKKATNYGCVRSLVMVREPVGQRKGLKGLGRSLKVGWKRDLAHSDVTTQGDLRTWLLCRCTRAQLAAWNTGYTYVNAVCAHIYGRLCGVTANCACEYAAVYIHSARGYIRADACEYRTNAAEHAMYRAV